MSRDDGLFTKVLLVTEFTSIVAAVAMTVVVIVRHHNELANRGHDDVKVVLEAKSACAGAAGTLATFRAWLEGAELPAEPSGPAPAVDDALRARGAALFAKHCATCHGQRGDGNGPTAAGLKDPPTAFATGTFELRTTEHEALPTDVDMFRTITRGIHGTAMPPWFALAERDRWALVAYVKTLSKQFQEDVAPPPIESVSPAVTYERWSHGGQLYTSAGCASCHGPLGHGDGPAGAALTYKSGVPVVPRDLAAGRFHRTTRLADIYLTIATGLDGTPMASFAKVMTPADLWDVAIYVQSLTPPIDELASGLRCPRRPIELRCSQLATGIECPDDPDELVGIRSIVQSFASR